MELCLTSRRLVLVFFFFFFNDTATTEIYTLSLHDALPSELAELVCGLDRSAAGLGLSIPGARSIPESARTNAAPDIAPRDVELALPSSQRYSTVSMRSERYLRVLSST